MKSEIHHVTFNATFNPIHDAGYNVKGRKDRKFVVFQEEEEDADCDETSNISTLTFLNFVLASLSIAASVSSNTNSNANANNDNNNNNNLNDNNVNIGNNNNNVNSQNMLTFQPMVGKRKRRRYDSDYSLLCKYNSEQAWLSKAAFDALEFFARLETCRKASFGGLYNSKSKSNNKVCIKEIVCEEVNRLKDIDIQQRRSAATQLLTGALRISLNVTDNTIYDC